MTRTDDVSELKRKAGEADNALLDAGISWYDCETLREEETFDPVEATYIAAASPSAVLALFACLEAAEARVKELEGRPPE